MASEPGAGILTADEQAAAKDAKDKGASVLVGGSALYMRAVLDET